MSANLKPWTRWRIVPSYSAPQEGLQGAAARPVAREPGQALPAGRADTPLLATGERPSARQAVGGKQHRDKRLEEACRGARNDAQPALPGSRKPRWFAR